ncbi:MAG: alpha/beta hydrolase, partial [Actinomycetota bacterium]|nr:alpha/beta hydrolase [Actinomycetota bacterium]
MSVALAGDESAPPLVLLHGLAERKQVFSRLARRLAPHVHTVAIDLPGFGASPPLPGGGFDLGVVCERVEGAIAELGLARPAMLGHSLGGGVTVRYAAERPGAVRAVVLVAPAG